jgi:endo-1,3(4)-beta-glucanase
MKRLALIVSVIIGGVIIPTILFVGSSRIPFLQQEGYSHPLVDETALKALEKKSGSSVSTVHLATGLLPPTNSWMSGMALQATALPVYPLPLSFLAKENGFEIGLPDVQSTATAITGGHLAGLSATVEGATTFQLTRYDKLSATLTYSRADKALGKLTLAQGSPFVYYRAENPSVLTIPNVESIMSGTSASYLRYRKAGHSYAITTNQGATIRREGSTARITAPKGSLVTAYGLESVGTDALRAFASNELRSVDVSYTQNNSASITEFKYITINNQATVFVPIAYADVIDTPKTLATYDSIYGSMKAYAGTSFKIKAPILTASNSLGLTHLTSNHRQDLIDRLKKDATSTEIDGKDSYYLGKQLARAASLLDISEQLNQTEINDHLKMILRKAFSLYLSPDSFYYDTLLKGVAAQSRSFGSEDFNDHHFHYGYIIYAASILGRYDSDFLAHYQKQINLLVADIASYSKNQDFIVQRYYDPYSAHSWAAGLAPFADGNNQESSSEAINAWNGIAKWAQLIGNSDLESSAEWMLSNEAATATRAWRKVDTRSPALGNYTSPIVSLAFGGKRVYATFFSDEPHAKLGIQLLPMSPVMIGFATDDTSIDTSVRASIQDDNFNVTLGDYILMYQALSDPQKAASSLDKQTVIDDGNSRTYLKAWVYRQLDK